ncbi:hypothetical protein PILCRDRAFT_433675 [Piloderma croceum F 1598]|uniref:Uncharacterized protein n=1 Tax=Piloderma croceum (strain F 1598) TaxID=765440 RepID=A0A0C3C2E6_PILCF|nr:hypothetical protein PILCRDRAFT_433675 [Piloderma croceum F 1598]
MRPQKYSHLLRCCLESSYQNQQRSICRHDFTNYQVDRLYRMSLSLILADILIVSESTIIRIHPRFYTLQRLIMFVIALGIGRSCDQLCNH